MRKVNQEITYSKIMEAILSKAAICRFSIAENRTDELRQRFTPGMGD